MKKSIKISHLVVNGCSYAYCSGLENIREQGWPSLVAKKLNVPIVNLAVRGSGNDGIFRRTYEYFFLNQPLNNFPFCINTMSFSGRREEFFVTFNNMHLNDILITTLKGDNDFEKMMLNNLTTDEGMLFAERKKLLFWTACLELFENHDIPYLTSDFIPTEKKYLDKLKDIFPNQYKFVHENKNKLNNLNEVAGNYDRVMSGHFGPIAQQVLAEYIYNSIIERYDIEVVAPESGFVDLESYYTNTPNLHKNNEWRKK